MDKIIGVAALVIFIGLGVYPMTVEDFSYGVRYYSQLGAAGFGAIYLLIIQNWKQISNFVQEKMQSFNKKKEEDVTKPKQVEKECPEKECCKTQPKAFNDLSALVYLRDRGVEIGSERAVEIIVELNTILFSEDVKWPTKQNMEDE